MAKHVETEAGVPCLLLQGAAGDLSANPPEGIAGPDEFGKRLGEDVLKLAATIKMTNRKDEGPSLLAAREELKFSCGVDVSNDAIQFALGKAVLPEVLGLLGKE